MAEDVKQSEIVAKLGFTQAFVSQLFSGERRLGWENSKIVAKMLGLDPAYVKDAPTEELREILKRTVTETNGGN